MKKIKVIVFATLIAMAAAISFGSCKAVCAACFGTGECNYCNGTGKDSGSTCDVCKGSGDCPMCEGKGKVKKADNKWEKIYKSYGEEA